MAIDEDVRAEIVRLSRAEGWPVGTIARHLGVHHSTVTRSLRANVLRLALKGSETAH